MRSIAACLAIMIAIGSVLVAQQQPARDAPLSVTTGTAQLSGSVVNEVTAQPVRRASVAISTSEGNLRLTSVTDDGGRYSFRDLPDGRYYISVSKAGFVTTNYGATKPQRPGTTFAIQTGEKKSLPLKIAPGAVITGTVRNRDGDPIAEARVSVLRPMPSYLTGEKTLGSIAGGFGESTDERGEFRIFGLPAGEYYVVATLGIGSRNAIELRETTSAEIDWATRQLQTPGGPAAPAAGRAVDYAPVFYPGVPNQAAAGVITLKTGEERRGVDVLLDLTPTAKISGTITNPAGDLPPNLQVNIIQHDAIPGIPFSGFGTARADASGRFSSAGLSPGDYTVTVRAAPARGGGAGSASALFALSTVTVNGVDLDTDVMLRPGVTVTGRLVFDAHTLKPPTDLSRTRVNLTAERSRTPTLGVPAAMADAQGNFRFVGVTPGRYRIDATVAGGWTLRTAIYDGRDVLFEPVDVQGVDLQGIEVTLTDLQTELSGDLLDANGKPAPDYFVIVFPVDRKQWVPQSRRIQSVRPATDGRFSFKNLGAGDFLIGAVTDVEQFEWYDPAFLSRLVEASTKVTLVEGEKKVQSLRIKGS